MDWERGDPVVLREIWRGRVWAARALIVVECTPDRQCFYGGPGAPWRQPVSRAGAPLRLPTEPWRVSDRGWDDARVLSFAWPRVAHAVIALWRGTAFDGWYINLQDPLRGTPIGFDTVDHVLDLVVSPDLSEWRWKDEDELAEAVASGMFSEHEAAEFRAEGERALARLLRREPPFDRDWSAWRPDPAWKIPALPPDWDVVETTADRER